MVRVKNVSGSSRFDKEDWIQYWSEQKGYRPLFCSACGQLTLKLVGGHVQKVFGLDKKWYITPLCEQCNPRTDSFEVDEQTLVPVPSNL